MKYLFIIVMYQDTSEPVCQKFGVMLDTTELCSFIPVGMMMFTQGHMVTEKLRLMQSLCCNAA